MSIENKIGKEKAFENWLSPDKTQLHLSYYSFDEFSEDDRPNCCKISSYDELFDKLDLYDTLLILTIDTDFIYTLPPNVLKFKKLKSITVKGCRWWNLNMTQIPESIEKIVLVDQTNLSPKCLIGMKKLINLKELYLDYSSFHFPDINDEYFSIDEYTLVPEDEQIPLIQIPNLSVYLIYNIYVEKYKFVKGWESFILDHYLFKNLKVKSISELNGNVKVILI